MSCFAAFESHKQFPNCYWLRLVNWKIGLQFINHQQNLFVMWSTWTKKLLLLQSSSSFFPRTIQKFLFSQSNITGWGFVQASTEFLDKTQIILIQLSKSWKLAIGIFTCIICKKKVNFENGSGSIAKVVSYFMMGNNVGMVVSWQAPGWNPFVTCLVWPFSNWTLNF